MAVGGVVSFLLVQAELASLHQIHGRKSLPWLWLHYASRLNSGVRCHSEPLDTFSRTNRRAPATRGHHTLARGGLLVLADPCGRCRRGLGKAPSQAGPGTFFQPVAGIPEELRVGEE